MSETKIVRAYGCVQCQEYHYEGDAEFEEHIMRQSKHGVERLPERPADKMLRELAK